MSTTPDIVVFADGAAIGNPGPGGWGTIVIESTRNVRELGGHVPHTTNNRMEMTAVIAGLEAIGGAPGTITICSDSSYLIQGITAWIHGWKRRGWKTASGSAVLNRDLWEQLDELAQRRPGSGVLRWQHVRGHAGIPGNERVDDIARGFAEGSPPNLYDGPFEAYEIEVFPLPAAGSERRTNSSTRRRGGKQAYSYLSLVDGRPSRHATWPECERRVKGVSGARFKKAFSAAEEVEILRGWGLGPNDL